ncbi:ADP-ribosylation factor GTPase-activating protein AGD4 [Morus notabilis]|uniref:ADP-ribosylation factor GTPase-activating protein AGD4 n=1 Tax=Morus notabilis TaxID=981085 RepID=W9SAA9_9ROSA|nr:ADP-ribosylation factor GTPase-activating protein AGD4 [Morus notabilis]
MAAFIRLDDSPMFQNQICSLELTADELKDRCQSLYKGCKNFMTALGEACNGDTIFADSLEAFGGGTDDPVSVSVGGPVMSKFISAFHELATYKELLRSQVEHVLIDRLMHFMTVDLQEAKDSRRRFDKAIHAYDQARERFVSLKKNTREDIVAELQEDLENSKSAFEKSRFNLVNALMNIEAKKKYEFLESVSAIMDAHLRYFKLGYELLKQLEPYIHQVLTYAQQSKEQAKVEQDRLAKRIQEFRTQAEMDALRASSNIDPSAGVNVIRVFGMNSHKSVEAIMQSRANGEVQTIKQGYLLKRSSSLRGDWKRRFFLLNSQGSLYYYRVKGTKPMGSHPQHFTRPAEQNSGMFGRFRSKHNRGASLNEDILSCRTVDLRTSLIKMDAEDSDLRLCFRIISPLKTYTLQAENEADRMDWINKITGAITSLLNSQFFDQPSHITTNPETNKSTGGASHGVQTRNSHQDLGDDIKSNKIECVSSILRGVPGNDLCAECSAPEPDWASLNLGILLCIECSGVHRNLGVHISKLRNTLSNQLQVRSLRLDVKVWEPTILDLFRNLGNAYCNSIWEGLLLLEDVRADDSNALIASTSKPCPKDAIHLKEKYIQAKSQTSDHRKNQTATMSGTSSVGDKSLDSGSAKSSSKPVLLSNTHDNLSSHPITTHKLNGENYLQWSQSVMLFIRGRGKTGFLTGATQKPKEGLESIETWESENALIMSWLINSMEPTISKTYMFLATAQEIWEAAKETFSDLGNSAQNYKDDAGTYGPIIPSSNKINN